MFSSETMSRDMSRNSSFLVSNPGNQNGFKHASAEGEFSKSREFMGTDLFQNLNNSNNQQQQQSHGLARYRSAPSSFLAELLDSTPDNSSSGDDEAEAFMFSAFANNPPDLNQKCDSNNLMQPQYSLKKEGRVEAEQTRPGQNGYETAGEIVGSYPLGMESQMNNHGNGNQNCSNLVRQSSSPAGFFNGFGVMGEVRNYRAHNHAEANSSASGGLSNHINFSSAPCTSSMFMPSIPKSGNESIQGCSPETLRPRNGTSTNSREYQIPVPQDSWNESPFNSLKRNRDGDFKMFANFCGSGDLNGEATKSSTGLEHHLSLPKTSAEMAALENILQFQPETTVACQIRAKRGCATHPRSIAERVRRTRISEKMKKLHDLFPNMDKQTNTADMLDIAVEHIKDLQKQVLALTDVKAKCVCSDKPQDTSPATLVWK